MIVRPATAADAEALAAIYGDAVLHGFGTFEELAPSAADMDGRRRAVQDQGLPYLVAEDDGPDGPRVLGFAYAAPFRPRAAYRYTLEDAGAYDRILGYSPYDQVSAQAYPPILATGGLSDPRVTYWEPAKWSARVRRSSTSGDPVLLKINMEAGHGGASGRFDFLKEIALDYAFAVWAVERGWEDP